VPSLPHHEDRNPSWRWDAGKARWFCSCGSGSVVDAAMRLYKVSGSDAIRVVRQILGGQAGSSANTERIEPNQPAGDAIDRRHEDSARRAFRLRATSRPADPEHPYL
jgi:putative DNA primase/helicase